MADIVTIPVKLSEGEFPVFVDLSDMKILIPIDFSCSREYIRGEVESRVTNSLLKDIECNANAYASLKHIADSIKHLDELHAYYPDEL